MAVLYDELLRKEWEELSARKHSFDVASVVGVVNDKVLRDAKALHDKFFGAPAAPTVSCVCVCALGIYNHLYSVVCLQVATPKSDWVPKWGKSDWAPKEWNSESKSGWAPKGEWKAGASKQGDKRKSEATCYKCGEAGHMAYQCPSKKQKQWN